MTRNNYWQQTMLLQCSLPEVRSEFLQLCVELCRCYAPHERHLYYEEAPPAASLGVELPGTNGPLASLADVNESAVASAPADPQPNSKGARSPCFLSSTPLQAPGEPPLFSSGSGRWCLDADGGVDSCSTGADAKSPTIRVSSSVLGPPLTETARILLASSGDSSMPNDDTQILEGFYVNEGNYYACFDAVDPADCSTGAGKSPSVGMTLFTRLGKEATVAAAAAAAAELNGDQVKINNSR